MSLRSYNAAFIVLCVIALLAMFSTVLINPLLAIFAKDLGAAGIWIGLSVSAYWIARVLMEIPSGFISTRLGYYIPLAVGLALTAVGNLLCAFVVDPIQLFLARVLMGLGAPLFFAVSMSLIINMFPMERRGSAMGFFQGVEFLGSTLASTFSGYIITELGFRGSFYLSTVMAITAIFLMMLPHVRREAKVEPASSSISLSSIRKVFTNGGLLTACSVTLVSYIFYQGVLFTTYPLYLNGIMKMSLIDIGFIQGARSAGYVLSMVAMGNVSDRIGRKPVILFGTVGTAVTSLLLNNIAGFYTISLAMFLIGITTGAIWIICPVISAEVVEPNNRGTAIGTYRTFFDTGSVLGPIIMIAVVEAYGYSMPFFLSTLLLFIVFIPALRLKETKNTRTRAS